MCVEIGFVCTWGCFGVCVCRISHDFHEKFGTKMRWKSPQTHKYNEKKTRKSKAIIKRKKTKRKETEKRRKLLWSSCSFVDYLLSCDISKVTNFDLCNLHVSSEFFFFFSYKFQTKVERKKKYLCGTFVLASIKVTVEKLQWLRSYNAHKIYLFEVRFWLLLLHIS